ncbi:MAG TPA: regulatory protein RecX [Thermoanaerobaculia bacterium]|nr:regulatory protein RecX [Thermoanaerobaculia bacterium]
MKSEDLTPSTCYAVALRILNYRFNSEAELRRKLAAKKFDDATVAATLARLREEKWLDDDRFAGAYVRTRVRKGIGRLRIRGELRNAGVSDDAAERAIREHGDGEEERLRAAYEKLSHRFGADRDKIAARLQRQGFEISAILNYLR